MHFQPGNIKCDFYSLDFLQGNFNLIHEKIGLKYNENIIMKKICEKIV